MAAAPHTCLQGAAPVSPRVCTGGSMGPHPCLPGIRPRSVAPGAHRFRFRGAQLQTLPWFWPWAPCWPMPYWARSPWPITAFCGGSSSLGWTSA